MSVSDSPLNSRGRTDAQIFGGIFGALFLKWCTPESMRGTLGSHDVNPLIYGSQAFLMELILTFVLIFVIFGVAVDRRGPGIYFSPWEGLSHKLPSHVFD